MTIAWSGHDQEGNTVSGSVPVTVKPRTVLCPVVPTVARDLGPELGVWLSAQVGPVALQAGDYRIDTTVALVGSGDLDVQMAGTTLRRVTPTPLALQYPKHNGHIRVTRPGHVILRSPTVRGLNTVSDIASPAFGAYNTAFVFEHGIEVDLPTTKVTVYDYDCDAVFGDGLYWRGAELHLERFRIDRNGRQGLSSPGTVGFVITSGTVAHSRRSGIDLEPNFNYDSIINGTISNVALNSWLVPFTAGGAGTVTDINVSDVVSTSATAPNISIIPNTGAVRARFTVARWTTTTGLGSPRACVDLKWTRDMVFEDVTIPCAPARAMVGVVMTSCGGSHRFTRCRFPGAARLAVTVTPAADFVPAYVDCSPGV